MSNDDTRNNDPDNSSDPRKKRPAEPEYRLVQIDNVPSRGYSEKDDIDPMELIKIIWNGRKTIYYSLVVFILLGLFIALGSGEEYTSEVKLMPETRQEGSLGRGGLEPASLPLQALSKTPAIPAALNPRVSLGSIQGLFSMFKEDVQS